MGIIWFVLICIVIGVLTGFLSGYWAVSTIWVPKRQSKPDLTTVVEQLDEKNLQGKKRILIAYNTKNGGSAGIGVRMREVLCQNGYLVDLRFIPGMMNEDISSYDAYIVGGAIYWSMLMGETKQFIAKHQELFKQKPTALFMVCGKMCNLFAPKLQGDEAKWRNLSLDYLEPMFSTMPDLKPALVDIGTFAGNIHFRFMNVPELTLMGLQMHRTGLKQGDYIDLDRVTTWTQKIAKKLTL
jgi:menaquinone-dependent protoporphyrinogen IX oxidase